MIELQKVTCNWSTHSQSDDGIEVFVTKIAPFSFQTMYVTGIPDQSMHRCTFTIDIFYITQCLQY